MPALILFKEQDFLSIAITYRRTNKKDASKDVVSRKVTLIKDIRHAAPHPGHLAILEDFALPTLSEFRGRDIKTFVPTACSPIGISGHVSTPNFHPTPCPMPTASHRYI